MPRLTTWPTLTTSTPTMACMYTKLQNTSGEDMHFAYLGAHGYTITAEDEVFVPGDIYSYLAANHPGIKGRRIIHQFLHDLETGLLSIEELPSADCYSRLVSSSAQIL